MDRPNISDGSNSEVSSAFLGGSLEKMITSEIQKALGATGIDPKKPKLQRWKTQVTMKRPLEVQQSWFPTNSKNLRGGREGERGE